jgi:hypothetical protein
MDARVARLHVLTLVPVVGFDVLSICSGRRAGDRTLAARLRIDARREGRVRPVDVRAADDGPSVARD